MRAARRLATSVALGYLLLGATGPARAQEPSPPAPPAPTTPASPAPPAPAPVDSLSLFLHALADSTDRAYGTQSVLFDTTGLDSLAEGALTHPPRVARHGAGVSPLPIARFHRAEGWVLGLGARAPVPGPGALRLEGAYGFGNHEGRYGAELRRTLARRPRLPRSGGYVPGAIGDRVTRLDLVARYERSTVPFMPEHAGAALSSFNPAWIAPSRLNVYEQRGVTAGLTLWTGDFRFDAGVRHAVEEAMPLVTRWTLFGSRASVVPNALAAADRYTEPWGGIAFARPDWELASALDARGGGGDRWRLHGAVGKQLRLGPSIKATLQVEAGATAAHAPPQRRFDLGGPRALPSLPRGSGSYDHLLLGKLDFVGSQDVLRGLGLHPPDWLVLQPFLFGQAGAGWDDTGGRDVVFARPPGTAWRGSAGAGFAYRLGIPDPSAMARVFMAWPVGRDAGAARLNLSLGMTFDLVGRR